MSDSIVLWRMCVVWGKSRPILVFASLLLVLTCVFNVTNIIESANQLGWFAVIGLPSEGDTELITTTYGGSNVGLATAFLSLVSNSCATILVGVKAV